MKRLSVVGSERNGQLTQPERLHHHALTGEASVPMNLYAHNLVTKFAIRVCILDEGELLRPSLSQGYGVDGLCSGRMRRGVTWRVLSRTNLGATGLEATTPSKKQEDCRNRASD